MDIVSEASCGERSPPAFRGSGSSSPELARRAARMAFALDSGILCFNVESEPELEALSAVLCRRVARADLDPHQSRR
jgi:diaminopimelate decarboxylase